MNTTDFGENTLLWHDRLACGELDEQTRKCFFAWLDAEPLRWRGCALACLEAQTWIESLEDLSASKETIGEAVRQQEETLAQLSDTSRAEFRAPINRTPCRTSTLAAVAALLLVGFGLGAFSRGWLMSPPDSVVKSPPPEEAARSGPLMATVSLRQEGSNIPATLQIPVMAVGNSTAESPAASKISEYDRQKWERRGFQLTKERRFLPVQLPDGKKVVVPVEQVKANYVGSKVS